MPISGSDEPQAKLYQVQNTDQSLSTVDIVSRYVVGSEGKLTYWIVGVDPFWGYKDPVLIGSHTIEQLILKACPTQTLRVHYART